MNRNVFLAACLWAGLCTLPLTAARADDGHDHGAAAASPSGPALPRFTAVSEVFELVGVLSGKQLTLYLDRAADNSPVPGAQIELEIGGAKFQAQKGADAVYEVVFKDLPKPGVLAVTATVTAGTENDLLVGELDVHEAAHSDETAHRHGWKEYAGWAVGGLVALALLAWAARRMAAARTLRAGGVA